jgi:hypothetical protein
MERSGVGDVVRVSGQYNRLLKRQIPKLQSDRRMRLSQVPSPAALRFPVQSDQIASSGTDGVLHQFSYASSVNTACNSLIQSLRRKTPSAILSLAPIFLGTIFNLDRHHLTLLCIFTLLVVICIRALLPLIVPRTKDFEGDYCSSFQWDRNKTGIPAVCPCDIECLQDHLDDSSSSRHQCLLYSQQDLIFTIHQLGIILSLIPCWAPMYDAFEHQCYWFCWIIFETIHKAQSGLSIKVHRGHSFKRGTLGTLVRVSLRSHFERGDQLNVFLSVVELFHRYHSEFRLSTLSSSNIIHGGCRLLSNASLRIDLTEFIQRLSVEKGKVDPDDKLALLKLKACAAFIEAMQDVDFVASPPVAQFTPSTLYDNDDDDATLVDVDFTYPSFPSPELKLSSPGSTASAVQPPPFCYKLALSTFHGGISSSVSHSGEKSLTVDYIEVQGEGIQSDGFLTLAGTATPAHVAIKEVHSQTMITLTGFDLADLGTVHWCSTFFPFGMWLTDQLRASQC